MNFDNIKYIFQIPLSWFKKVHNLLFKCYGTDFIKLKEGEYGGLEVGVDNEQFENRVADIASSVTPSLSGVVKSVDGHNPDTSGAVSFGLSASKTVCTDTNGHLTTISPYSNSNTVTVVTGVTWNGTQLVIENKDLVFSKGILTNVATNTNSKINTVTYN